MTTPPSFPTLAGQGWSLHKRPTFSTRVAAHVSGREVRSANYVNPLYEFELTYDGLDTIGLYPGLGAQSQQALMGLYLQAQGQFGTFLYTDPSDHKVTSQAIGQGDGTTTSFTAVRNLGGYVEPVGWVTALTAVYVNGTALTSGFSLTTPNTIVFTSAPAAGAALTADFTYAFQCRFLDDQEDFENVMLGLWQMQSLKFRSVR